MNDATVFLVGAGGHGRVTLAALMASGASIQGIFDPELAPGSRVMGVEVLGDDGAIPFHCRRDHDRLAIGIGVPPRPPRPRARLFDALQVDGYTLATVIHPFSFIDATSTVGTGAQVMAGSVIQPGVVIDEGVIVNTRASVDHDCHIQRHAVVCPGAVLCGEVTVGAHAFIGSGAVIAPRVHIGEEAVVGAGAVVLDDIAPRVFVAGNPARNRQASR